MKFQREDDENHFINRRNKSREIDLRSKFYDDYEKPINHIDNCEIDHYEIKQTNYVLSAFDIDGLTERDF